MDLENVFTQDLQRMRRLLSLIMEKAEAHFSGEKILVEAERPWGKNDSLMDIVYKMTPIFLKLDPIEYELKKGDHENAKDEKPLSQAEWNILRDYIERMGSDAAGADGLHLAEQG